MANVLKIWWATKFLTRNLMDSSYISHLRDSTPSFFLHPYLIIDRMIVNSVAKVQSGCVKNWHRRRKDEEGRLNWRWNTICILPRKEYDHDSGNSIVFTFETNISETAVSKVCGSVYSLMNIIFKNNKQPLYGRQTGEI